MPAASTFKNGMDQMIVALADFEDVVNGKTNKQFKEGVVSFVEEILHNRITVLLSKWLGKNYLYNVPQYNKLVSFRSDLEKNKQDLETRKESTSEQFVRQSCNTSIRELDKEIGLLHQILDISDKQTVVKSVKTAKSKSPVTGGMKNKTRRHRNLDGGGKFYLDVSLKEGDVSPFTIPIRKEQFDYLNDDKHTDIEKKKLCLEIINKNKTYDVREENYHMHNVSKVVHILEITHNQVYIYAFCSMYSTEDDGYPTAEEYSKAMLKEYGKTKLFKVKTPSPKSKSPPKTPKSSSPPKTPKPN